MALVRVLRGYRAAGTGRRLFAPSRSSGAVTAPGVTLTASAVFVPGSTAVAVPGVLFAQAGSFLAGGAFADNSGSAAGVTFPPVASFLPGAASAVRNVTAAGVTLAVAASFIAGAASSNAAFVRVMRSYRTGGSLLRLFQTSRAGALPEAGGLQWVGDDHVMAIDGPAAAGLGAMFGTGVPGVTLLATVTFTAGAATGSTGDATAPGAFYVVPCAFFAGPVELVTPAALLEVGASFLPGTAFGEQNPVVLGAMWTVVISFDPGRDATAPGVDLAGGVSFLPGGAGGDIVAPGVTFTVGTGLIVGTASGIDRPPVDPPPGDGYDRPDLPDLTRPGGGNQVRPALGGARRPGSSSSVRRYSSGGGRRR